MKPILLRIAGFSGAPVLSALAPFLLLPVISRLTGPDGWANFSTGQSIGILGMVAVLFGWGIVGPVRVAQATDDDERAAILRESLRSRAVTVAFAAPAAAAVTAVVTTADYKLESVLIAVAMTLGGLTPAWYCIGAAQPKALTIYDAAPKLLASLVALPILLATSQILWYPILLGVVTVTAVVLHARGVLRGRPSLPKERGQRRRTLRSLLPTAAIDAAGNAYGTTPVPIATAGLSPADASSFASADRIYRVGTLAVVAFGNAFQSWVLEPKAVDRVRRQFAALTAHAALGVVGGASIALIGPWATALLFGPAVAADPFICVCFGIAFLCISTTTPLIRNMLVPHGRYRFVLAATLIASSVGLVTMVGGAIAGSAAWIGVGVAAAEATSLAILIGPALASLRRPVLPDAVMVPSVDHPLG